MKKNILIFIFVSITAIFFLISQKNTLFPGYKTTTAAIGGKTYRLYIADTPEKQKIGLSNTPLIKNNEGIIFVFDKPGLYGFWMKDMKFALDFIFIKDGLVVDILENIGPATYPKVFMGKEPYDIVIELSAGEVTKSKINLSEAIVFTNN